MQEVEDDELLSGDEAYSYYQSLKLQNVENWVYEAISERACSASR
jgi:hypothetical protein